MRTDTRWIRVIDGEVEATAEVPPPWLRPPVVTRYSTPRARWSARIRRLRHSRLVADVRDRWRSWLTAVGFLAVAWLLLRLADLLHALAPAVTGSWS